MIQSAMTMSSADRRPTVYAFRASKDTYLKLSTAQSSSLPNDQKQLVRAGTTLPIVAFRVVTADHLQITLGVDKQGQKIHIRGRNTWFVYRLDAEILRNGQAVALEQTDPTPPLPVRPATATYTLNMQRDTWLKQSTAQSTSLPDEQKQLVSAGTVLPISGFRRVENDHLQVTFGLDDQGNQVQYQGRNTWYVYRPGVEVLRNGQPIALGQMPSAPTPTPTTTPTPTPTPTSAPPIPTSPFNLILTTDTYLKQSTAQSSSLPEAQKQLLGQGTTLPLASFKPIDADHLQVVLGKNSQGQQVQYQGRNTWYVYRPAVQILQDGKPIDLSGLSTPGLTGRKQINDKGLRLLKSFEGLRLNAYLDAVGVWTIGYGTTSGVRPGMQITALQAEEFLKRDLVRFERAVAELVRVPLNEDQFSALVSFTYNVGESALANSTLLKLLNRGDYRGAADQLLRWNKGDGVELPGLTRRRRAERALFLGQDYTVFL